MIGKEILSSKPLSSVETTNCKVIIDSGSCINAVSSKLVSLLGLKLVAHPKPYKVSWVDDSSITIKDRCLVPIHILSYKAQISCDVIPMDVGHIILGQPWIYDLDVTLYGCSNSCFYKGLSLAQSKLSLLVQVKKNPKSKV